MTNYKAHIYTAYDEELSSDKFGNNLHIFYGDILDDRGQLLKDSFKSATWHKVKFNAESMELSVDGNLINFTDTNYLGTYKVEGASFLIDSTTLNLPEIYYLIKQFIALKITYFKVLYIEPKEYTKDPDSDFYQLSNYPIGYKPIPGAVTDLHQSDVEIGVFFIGFDSTRVQIALEEFQMIQDKNIKVIFGTPAFHAGLELESIYPHLEILSENRDFHIDYCSAIDPASAYDLLNYFKKALDDGNKLFIAPIGPKPTTIASALFANIFPNETSLLYDHPENLQNRTRGVNGWYTYSVYLNQI